VQINNDEDQLIMAKMDRRHHHLVAQKINYYGVISKAVLVYFLFAASV